MRAINPQRVNKRYTKNTMNEFPQFPAWMMPSKAVMLTAMKTANSILWTFIFFALAFTLKETSLAHDVQYAYQFGMFTMACTVLAWMAVLHQVWTDPKSKTE